MNHFLIPVFSIIFIVSQYCLAQPKDSKIQDEISYSNDIKPIVWNFCTTCHAGENPEGEFVLTSYESVRKHVEKGKLIARINDAKEPMPPNGLMPQYMRRLFKLWADGGYINEGKAVKTKQQTDYAKFTPPKITPVNINKRGFELLEQLQGHWVGSMNLMGQKFDWMAFDYRPISPSHIHGMFEGGTIGNLMTSFFVTNLNGQRTIMARNGGLLNGIYRMSYFVLDQVQYGNGWSYYRLVDAYGGEQIMWMELTFHGNTMEFNSYTSRFGLTEPKLHMVFQAKRKRPQLAQAAAQEFGFPQNKVEVDLSEGLPEPSWMEEGIPQTTASYLWEDSNKSITELGKLAKDPIRIDQMPHLSQLTVRVNRNSRTEGKKLLIFLSAAALADQRGQFITRYGYIKEELLDTILLYPEISDQQNEFTFTYLHPGTYYVTVIADMDGDSFPSPGDITHPQTRIVIKPETHVKLNIDQLEIAN